MTATIATLAAVVAAAGVAAASYRQSHFRPTAWMLVAGALALAAVGHVIWYWLDLHEMEPFPSFADVFYLAVYPLLMGALWILGHDSARDDGALDDALIVGTSAAVIGWVLVIQPYMEDPSLSLSQLLVLGAYPVLDLILLPRVPAPRFPAKDPHPFPHLPFARHAGLSDGRPFVRPWQSGGLVRAGWSEGKIRKVMGENWLSVLDRVW